MTASRHAPPDDRPGWFVVEPIRHPPLLQTAIVDVVRFAAIARQTDYTGRRQGTAARRRVPCGARSSSAAVPFKGAMPLPTSKPAVRRTWPARCLRWRGGRRAGGGQRTVQPASKGSLCPKGGCGQPEVGRLFLTQGAKRLLKRACRALQSSTPRHRARCSEAGRRPLHYRLNFGGDAEAPRCLKSGRPGPQSTASAPSDPQRIRRLRAAPVAGFFPHCSWAIRRETRCTWGVCKP